MSRFNREWFDSGRKARFKAEAVSKKSGELTILPESSYNATAHSYWRQGWNSVTKQELTAWFNGSTKPQRIDAEQHITTLRNNLGVHQ
jgi:hypothetical protein